MIFMRLANMYHTGLKMDIGDNRFEKIYQAIHHQFVATAKTVQLCHKMLKGAQIGAMVAHIPSYQEHVIRRIFITILGEKDIKSYSF